MRVIGSFTSSAIQALVLTVFVFASVQIGLAQVRSSTNYQLQSDSINVGGGYSSSTNYQQESTVGEIATGESASTNFTLYAGYQQMQAVYLSLSTTGDVNMTPDLFGLTGGEANGSTTVTVVTDSPSGYQLTIEAENDPAMQSDADTIDDYDAGVESDFSFTYGSNEAVLGMTPEGVDIVQAFLDNGSTCNTGSSDGAFSCWDGLSTVPFAISEGSGSNHPDGATTTLHFRIGIGSTANVTSGVYVATTTITALPL